MEHKFEPGSKVELLERGEWEGPYEVVDNPDRRYGYVILRGKYCDFEVYNDYPYNIRHFDPKVWIEETVANSFPSEKA